MARQVARRARERDLLKRRTGPVLSRWGVGLVATVSGAAGMAAGQHGWVGTWLVVASVISVALGVVLLAWDRWVDRVAPARVFDRVDREQLLAVLTREPAVVAEVAPEEVGAFRSAEATRLAGAHPPYVERDIDAQLQIWIKSRGFRNLITIKGSPKSGKSRTGWEAVRMCFADHIVIAVRTPSKGGASDVATEPLTGLVDLPLRGKGNGIVVWIDNAHEHIGRGLWLTTLQKLQMKWPQALLILTIHADELANIEQLDKDLAERIQAGTGGLELEVEFSRSELSRLPEAYASLEDPTARRRLPEYLAGVPLLRRKYRDNTAAIPVGIALFDAAVVWRQCGMPPDCPRDDLFALSRITIHRLRPGRQITDEELEEALTWVTDPIAAWVSLLQRDDEHPHLYRAFDAVVNLTPGLEERHDNRVWTYVMERLKPRDGLAVGNAACAAQRTTEAACAFEQARGHAEYAQQARLGLGALYVEAGDRDNAITAYSAVIASGHAEAAPHAHVRLGLLHYEASRFDEAITEYEAAIASGHAEAAPHAHVTLGLLHFEAGREEEAVAEYEAFIASGDPFWAALIQFALGLLHYEAGRFDEAIGAYKAIIDGDLPEVTPMARYELGFLYTKLGRREEAIAEYEDLIASGAGRWVDMTHYLLAVEYFDADRFEEATAEFEGILANGHDPVMASLAQLGLADLYGKAGRFEEAIVKFEGVLASGHVEEAIAKYEGIRGSGHYSMALLLPLRIAVLCEKAGRFEEAIAKYEDILAGGHYSMALLLPLRIADLYEKTGRFEEAIAKYEGVLAGGHESQPELAPLCLGLLYEKTGRFEEAIAKYEVVIAIGASHGGSFLAELQLGSTYIRAGRDAAAIAMFRGLSAADVVTAGGHKKFIEKAQFNLGVMQYVAGNRQAAYALWTSACETSVVWVLVTLALVFSTLGDPWRGHALLVRAADLGGLEALTYAAVLIGEADDKTMSETEDLASQGDCAAMNVLGVRAFCQCEHAVALQWWQQSVDRDDVAGAVLMRIATSGRD